MSSDNSDEKFVMDPDHGEIPDLRNSKGHGFYCFKHDGVYLYIVHPSVLKGVRPADHLRSIKEAELKDDDIFICAYPKCGTHWLWEVIEMLKSGTIKYQKDVKETRMLELISKDGIEAVPQPRVFNTHLHLRMLPKQVVEKKIKCFQIMRNPKDACVSFFNHCRDMTPPYDYEGDFVEFTEAFLSEKMAFGSYSTYLLSWKAEVAAAPELPVLDLFYEDMKFDPVKTVKDVARTGFLGLSSTDQFCEEVADACSFKKMKKVDQEMKGDAPIKIWADGKEGTFYRKLFCLIFGFKIDEPFTGQLVDKRMPAASTLDNSLSVSGEIGDWKNWFTVAENERFDQIWNAKMKDSGFKFTYTPV
ncbi:sulfotransferase 1B1-like [Haliotis rubra]|uniref:sulfotransferase 1B1-like n=1 Tax=Haliotis rubra TaxID=36100 RepID=UPI001EE5B180|nr:sulfotransferase 1B1-like [Haliotis rubra]